MKKLILIVLTLLTFISAYAEDIKRPSATHEKHFEGTDYELNIYKVYGRKDGKTMFILGGIQGDEPGGFLSADLYSDLKLEQGNLIVIPRANFKSIILYDRGPDGDMNRRFAKNHKPEEMDRVVEVIKKLMSESDVFLNLHDGWGYHNPVYIDELRNPKKFGQSIITDADNYTCSNGKILDLNTPAKTVLKAINEKIGDEQYFLHYFNTKTDDPSTKFSDMRKTATFYALQEHCIPAFGIESSKNLPSLEMKVLYHNYAVNEFMKIYDIIPEHPQVLLAKPELKYAIVSINGQPEIIDNRATAYVNQGDVVEITHIEANYDRGVSCDILGYGVFNDYRSKIVPKSSTKVIFRKDNDKMGEITIQVNKPQPAMDYSVNGKYFVFIVKHNGKKFPLMDGDVISVREKDNFELIAAISDQSCSSGYPINLKGYVPNVPVNNGDDRGYNIVIERSRFMTKYSKNGLGLEYPAVVKVQGVELGQIWLRIEK